MAHRRYFHSNLNEQEQEDAFTGSMPSLRWSDKEAIFWQQLLDGHVLLGHNIGVDLDSLQDSGVSLENTGLIDSLELALLVTPLMQNEEGRRDHSLHSLGKQLAFDQNDLLKGIGVRHEALYDSVLCLLLVREMLGALRDWPSYRLEALLQLLSPNYYLRRFLETQLKVSDLRVERVPLKRVLGEIAQPSERERSSVILSPSIPASQILGSDGPFAQKITNFHPREVQCELATQIETCLREGGVLIAEAGTGTGKSLAAMVPAIGVAHEMGSGPVVISTYTHILQEQLATKDLPTLEDALGHKVQTAILKGRGNYLNLQAFDAQRTAHLSRLRADDDSQETRNQGLFLASLLSWACSSLDKERSYAGDLRHLFMGDLSEASASWFGRAYGKDFLAYLHSLEEFPPLVNELERPAKLASLFWRAVQYAKQADLVVVNHSLWFSSKPVQELSPYIIFDEAHHLEEAITNALSVEVTADGCRGWVRLVQGLAASCRGSVSVELSQTLFSSAQRLEGAVPGFALLFRKCLDALVPNEPSQKKEDRDLAEDAPYSRKKWLSQEGIDLTATARTQDAWLDAPAGMALANSLTHFQSALSDLEAALTEEHADEKRLVRSLLEQVSQGLELLRTIQAYNFEEADRYCWWMEEDERDLGVAPDQARQFAFNARSE